MRNWLIQMMEAEKSHNLQSARQRPREVSDVIGRPQSRDLRFGLQSMSEGLRARR